MHARQRAKSAMRTGSTLGHSLEVGGDVRGLGGPHKLRDVKGPEGHGYEGVEAHTVLASRWAAPFPRIFGHDAGE